MGEFGEFFETDTALLQKDAAALEEKAEAIHAAVQRLYTGVAELNGYWEGMAKNAFEVRIQKDMEFFEAMGSEIRALCSDLQYAQSEYVKCEDEVRSIIAAVKV